MDEFQSQIAALGEAKVLITGHTGFTGSWISTWLHSLGTKIVGISLPTESPENLFDCLGLTSKIDHHVGDIRDYKLIHNLIAYTKPNLVLHLAAQPLVLKGYRLPLETFQTNSEGTLNVIDAAIKVDSVTGVLCVTTDKVYKNLGLRKPFVEEDTLGGLDPYSASKVNAENIIASYQDLIKQGALRPMKIVSARGGNIIGGGDWSEDRIVPDFIRAWRSGGSIYLRYPNAVRPWQHVISLAEGYLRIMGRMIASNQFLSNAYNFGPTGQEELTVASLLDELSVHLGPVSVNSSQPGLKEHENLHLESSKSQRELNWIPRWSATESIRATAEWYRRFYSGEDARSLCLEQIDLWQTAGSSKELGRE